VKVDVRVLPAIRQRAPSAAGAEPQPAVDSSKGALRFKTLRGVDFGSKSVLVLFLVTSFSALQSSDVD